jgi:hypothetical protein
MLTARIDFNLSPDLTIQYYASPFITAGEYSEIKKIINPKADQFENRFYTFGNELSYSDENGTYSIDESGDGIPDYSFGKPDFNFKQLRSNLVIRWEYTPGSMLFLVWSQGKTEDSFSRFHYFNDMEKLLSVKGHNTFLIKISHRIRAERIKIR